ncbi:MAG: restriction endonuclease subunit S [Microcella pacifica]
MSLDRKRRPVRSLDRRPGPYPYYGASGVVDYVDDYIFEGLHLLVAEDGENLRSRKTPVAFLANGKFWVNNHAHVLVANDENDTRFLSYLVESLDVSGYLTGSTQPKLTQAALGSIPLFAPGLDVQRSIAQTLGALDEKVESNEVARRRCFELAQTFFRRSAEGASSDLLKNSATVVLGGTPNKQRADYWEDGVIPWINSGSANQDIVLEPNELITEEALRGSAAKLMPAGATVVAITGATLGQVALLGISTAGNQSLVGVWADSEALTFWLHFALHDSMDQLVRSATGAAQQHVNKGNIEQLEVPIPSARTLADWAEVALPLVRKGIQLSQESLELKRLRDSLLPELLSGRLLVKPEVSA